MPVVLSVIVVQILAVILPMVQVIVYPHPIAGCFQRRFKKELISGVFPLALSGCHGGKSVLPEMEYRFRFLR